MATDAEDDGAVFNSRHPAESTTYVSRRDWERLLALLDDADAQPNDALIAAAKRYRDRV